MGVVQNGLYISVVVNLGGVNQEDVQVQIMGGLCKVVELAVRGSFINGGTPQIIQPKGGPRLLQSSFESVI